MEFQTVKTQEVQPESVGLPSGFLSFEFVSLRPRAVCLRCRTQCFLDGEIGVFVEGIIIGRRNVLGRFDSGAFLEIPVHYFPHAILPTKVRCVLQNVEIAPAFAISSSEEVMLILGLGEISVRNLLLENSLLQGTIVNLTNGIYAPSAFIKINGQVVRAAIVEPPLAVDGGGSSSRFAVHIRPSDFTESGIYVDFYLSGMDFPIANFTYTRSPPTADAKRLIEMDETVSKTQKSMFLQIEMLRDSLDQRLNLQQERIDTFIEFAMSLIIDQLAGQAEPLNGKAFLEGLLNLKSTVAPAAVRAPQIVTSQSSKLSLSSPNLVFGWYDVESNENGSFRWMGQASLVRNPYPARQVSRVELVVSQVYGTHEPMLKAALDQQDFVTSFEKVGKTFILTFRPPPEQCLSGESLYITSFVTGCPAADEGTTDTRTLSVAVVDITFFFEKPSDVNV